jgi:hypothetical protein
MQPQYPIASFSNDLHVYHKRTDQSSNCIEAPKRIAFLAYFPYFEEKKKKAYEITLSSGCLFPTPSTPQSWNS